MLKFECNSDP